MPLNNNLYFTMHIHVHWQILTSQSTEWSHQAGQTLMSLPAYSWESRVTHVALSENVFGHKWQKPCSNWFKWYRKLLAHLLGCQWSSGLTQLSCTDSISLLLSCFCPSLSIGFIFSLMQFCASKNERKRPFLSLKGVVFLWFSFLKTRKLSSEVRSKLLPHLPLAQIKSYAPS